MAYDTFVGLAAGQSIQGATWDDGGNTWLNPTYLIGDGADSVKISGVPNGFVVAANVAPAAAPASFSIFFKPGSGRSSTAHAISIMLHGTGSSGSQYGGGGLLLSVGAYGAMILKDTTGGGAANVEVTGVTLSDTQEYCLELVRTTNANNREYVGNLYSSSGGVRGALLKTTPAMTISSERPTTARLSQIFMENAPNLTITRVETAAAPAAVAPVLSVPTATATSSTSVSGTVATDKAGGTLRYLFSANTTETAATLKASGASQVVTATGSQTVNITGRTAGETGRIHYLQVDAGGLDSNVVSSSPVTLPAPDTQAPTFAGGSAITPGAVTQNSLSGSYPAATDNVAVTGYQYSINSGASWVENGTGTTFTVNGLSPSTTYPVWIRAKDAAGNFSTPLQTSMTTAAATTGSFKSSRMSNGALSAWPSGTAVSWEWLQGGRIGSAPTSTTRGTGTLASDKTLTVTGCPVGAGVLLVSKRNASAATDDVYYEAGTVA